MRSVSRDDPVKSVKGQSRESLVHQAQEFGLVPAGKGEQVGGGEQK